MGSAHAGVRRKAPGRTTQEENAAPPPTAPPRGSLSTDGRDSLVPVTDCWRAAGLHLCLLSIPNRAAERPPPQLQPCLSLPIRPRSPNPALQRSPRLPLHSALLRSLYPAFRLPRSRCPHELLTHPLHCRPSLGSLPIRVFSPL